ncbi:hypothetical protein AAHH67_25280 [Niallia circulans]
MLIKEERAQLVESFEKGQGISRYEAQRLEEDTTRREKFTQLQFKLEQQNESYERVLEGFEKWEGDFLSHQKLLRQLADELKIPYELATQQIYDAFLLIEEWKGKDRERNSYHQELDEIHREREEIISKISNFFIQFLEDEKDTIANMCYRLKTALKEEKRKRIEKKHYGQSKQTYQRIWINIKQSIIAMQKKRLLYFPLQVLRMKRHFVKKPSWKRRELNIKKDLLRLMFN